MLKRVDWFRMGVFLALGLLAGAGWNTTLRADEPASDVLLCVEGLVDPALRLTAADLAAMPRVKIKATEPHKNEAEFEGVPLAAILKKAGVPMGEWLRGEAITTIIIVTANDGYHAVYTLAELDPEFNDKVVILADRRNGEPITDPNSGPLRIIAPTEKRHGRWVRMVNRLTVQRVAAPTPEPSR